MHTSDRIQFTRNNHRAERRIGQIAEMVAIDARALYVAVSRARDHDRTMLTTAIVLRDGHQAAALNHDKGWEFGG